MSIAVCVALLTGCTPAPTVIEDSSVTVAIGQSFYSLNDKTSYGASPANSAILQAVSSSFNRYDDVPKLVPDTSFGTYQVLDYDPLTVRYTIAPNVVWSDGVPVDASDLLLAWAANSGVLNTKDFDDSPYIDQETGRYAKEFPKDVVYFDGATRQGLHYVTKTPVIGEDGRSLTLTFDQYFVDWPLLLDVGLPAHVVAEHVAKLWATPSSELTDAERLTQAGEAKDWLIEVIQKKETAKLSAVANFWNSGFNLETMPADRSLLVSTGPYTITDIDPGNKLTLTANPKYHGSHSPVFEKITVAFVADPLIQVQGLRDGTFDVITPQVNLDVSKALGAASASTPGGTTVEWGSDGTYEHLDLRSTGSKSGVFADERVRRAFLKVIPRQAILDALVSPLYSDAVVRSSQLFFPGSPNYLNAIAENGSSEFERVDVSGAQALLAAAGVSSPVVCVMFDPSNPKRLQEFQLIHDSAALGGFVVTSCASPDWLSLLSTPGTYDASLFGWKVTNLSVAGEQAIFGTGGRNNFNEYSNQDVDELFAKLAVTTNDSDRVPLRTEIDSLLFADGYGAPLFQAPAVVAFSQKVSGVKLAPFAPGILWNVWDWQPVTVKPSDE